MCTARVIFHDLRRYSFKETFGKWRTGDLLLGLAYLARKEQASTSQVERVLQGRLVEQHALSEPHAAGLRVRGARPCCSRPLRTRSVATGRVRCGPHIADLRKRTAF